MMNIKMKTLTALITGGFANEIITVLFGNAARPTPSCISWIFFNKAVPSQFEHGGTA